MVSSYRCKAEVYHVEPDEHDGYGVSATLYCRECGAELDSFDTGMGSASDIIEFSTFDEADHHKKAIEDAVEEQQPDSYFSNIACPVCDGGTD